MELDFKVVGGCQVGGVLLLELLVEALLVGEF